MGGPAIYDTEQEARAVVADLCRRFDNLHPEAPEQDESGGWNAVISVEIGTAPPEARGAAIIVPFTGERSTEEPAPAPLVPPVPPTPFEPARPAPALVVRATKRDMALTAMRRAGGAEVEELRALLGWAPHTLRSFVSVENKAGRNNISMMRRGGKTYYMLEIAK